MKSLIGPLETFAVDFGVAAVRTDTSRHLTGDAIAAIGPSRNLEPPTVRSSVMRKELSEEACMEMLQPSRWGDANHRQTQESAEPSFQLSHSRFGTPISTNEKEQTTCTGLKPNEHRILAFQGRTVCRRTEAQRRVDRHRNSRAATTAGCGHFRLAASTARHH